MKEPEKLEKIKGWVMLKRPENVERTQRRARIAIGLPFPFRPLVKYKIEKEADKIKRTLLDTDESKRMQKELGEFFGNELYFSMKKAEKRAGEELKSLVKRRIKKGKMSEEEANKFIKKVAEGKIENSKKALYDFLIGSFFNIKSPMVRWDMVRRANAMMKGITPKEEELKKVGVEGLLEDAFKTFTKGMRNYFSTLSGDPGTAALLKGFIEHGGVSLYHLLSVMIADNVVGGGVGLEKGGKKAKEKFVVPEELVREWYDEVKREQALEQAKRIIEKEFERDSDEGKEESEKRMDEVEKQARGIIERFRAERGEAGEKVENPKEVLLSILPDMKDSELIEARTILGDRQRIEAAKELILKIKIYKKSYKEYAKRELGYKPSKDGDLYEFMKRKLKGRKEERISDKQIREIEALIMKDFEVYQDARYIHPKREEVEEEIIKKYIEDSPIKAFQELYVVYPGAGLYPHLMPFTLRQYGGKEWTGKTMEGLASKNNTEFHAELIGKPLFYAREGEKRLLDSKLRKRIEYFFQYFKDAGFSEKDAKTMIQNGIEHVKIRAPVDITSLYKRQEWANEHRERALSLLKEVNLNRRIQTAFSEENLYGKNGLPDQAEIKKRIERCLTWFMQPAALASGNATEEIKNAKKRIADAVFKHPRLNEEQKNIILKYFEPKAPEHRR